MCEGLLRRVTGTDDGDRPLIIGAELAADEQERGAVVDGLEVDRVAGVEDRDERDPGGGPARDLDGRLRQQRLRVDGEQGRLAGGAVERRPQDELGIAARRQQLRR